MSDVESRPAGMNKGVIALLGVIVVLLAVIVGIIAFGGVGNKTATPTVADQGQATTDASSTANMPSSGSGEFDPATATRVADGKTPEDHVKAYFDAIVGGKYEDAYNLLPADKKAAQDAASFGEQLKGYGIESYKMGETTTSGEDTLVNATATMAGGSFDYVWTFTKVDGKWVVKSRELAGMGQ